MYYFVMRTADDGRPEAGRRIGWFSYDEALNALSFENSRALLRSVSPLLRSVSPLPRSVWPDAPR